MKYIKHNEVKILRTRHEVTLSEGQCRSLVNCLDYVPLDAMLINVYENDTGHTVLVFELNQKEAQ